MRTPMRALRPVKRPRFEYYDFHPKLEDLRSQVLSGLVGSPKWLAPKFFYDERGSDLFSEICALPEYYLTRAELGLLRERSGEISEYFQESCVIIEYGCGSSEKIHLLLEAAQGCRAYAAVDISKQPLLKLAEGLSQLHPSLEIMALCADFMAPFPLPLNGHGRLKKIAFFPGSSIGNFDPAQAIQFLSNVALEVGKDGGLLIGVDLKKDPKILHAAYNDARGTTARFNKNILARINRECGANFNLDRFSHRAFYNEEAGRIEMHLVSQEDQEVSVNGTAIRFAKGESLHTENSYKYHVEEFQGLAAKAGWNPRRCWTDSQNRMSLHYLQAR